jgi:hypothetical protein
MIPPAKKLKTLTKLKPLLFNIHPKKMLLLIAMLLFSLLTLILNPVTQLTLLLISPKKTLFALLFILILNQNSISLKNLLSFLFQEIFLSLISSLIIGIFLMISLPSLIPNILNGFLRLRKVVLFVSVVSGLELKSSLNSSRLPNSKRRFLSTIPMVPIRLFGSPLFPLSLKALNPNSSSFFLLIPSKTISHRMSEYSPLMIFLNLLTSLSGNMLYAFLLNMFSKTLKTTLLLIISKSVRSKLLNATGTFRF